MKNIFLVLVFILLSGAAQATQNHIFACSYLEGKGPADLEKWFNEYGKAGLDNAGGNAKITVLTPSVNNNPEYDFIWIEEYEEFEALGKQAGHFFDPNGSQSIVPQKAFEIWTCHNSIWAGEVFYSKK